MRKLILLAAMVAMVLSVDAPAMAIVLQGTATVDQTGGDITQTGPTEDATQYQFAPGGDADATVNQYQYNGDDDDNPGRGLGRVGDNNDGNQYQYANADATGGAGGTQDLDQVQRNPQSATQTFSADQVAYSANIVAL